MKKQAFVIVVIACSIIIHTLTSCQKTATIGKPQLQDKIMGGWAGQVIGCTYGGPTEFKFNGKIIPTDHAIPWNNESCLWYYKNSPGLYDDIYMDLTFVNVFEKEGLDAPAKSHALAFANAEYKLWHANQAARYNILNGIMPPESGHWLNNPHSEDIDFQIEADFAGLMSPGMVNHASEICDKIGHIMNYGDGWYGGVYVAAMYSLAFISDDIDYVVSEALKAIPQQSTFHQCMSDVIRWHQQYPEDWEKTWEVCQQKWSNDIGCPDGVFTDFNIDAKINAAYILVGLLYGQGDYGETIDISTRCGQDSDCNPASAAGILGTMIGYKNIPDKWKTPLNPVVDMKFNHTTMSLNDVYRIGNKHALEVLQKNGAKIKDDNIQIPITNIKPVKLEIGYEGHYPHKRLSINKTLESDKSEITIETEGTGFIVKGKAYKTNKDIQNEYTFKLEMYIDGKLTETFNMPTSFKTRRHDIAWRFQMPEKKHLVKIRVINPNQGFAIKVDDIISFTSNQAKSGYNN